MALPTLLRLLLAVATLSVLSGGVTAACGPGHHDRWGRRLLQGGPGVPASAASPAGAAAAAPSPATAPGDGSTIIVDEVVDQKCSVMHRALVAGDVLRPGASNLQADETACCRSCLADDRCTAWVYCPDPAGCNATEAAAAAAASNAGTPLRRDSADLAAAPSPEAEVEAAGHSLYLPYRGCRLLSIPAFRLRKDSPQVVAKGASVPYISGTPVSIVLPALPGFSVRPGTETHAGYGYKCEGSLLLHSCLLQAPVEDLASMCNADPQCMAFVYLPNGLDSVSEPIGIFKGGPSIRSLPMSALQHNPSTALYIKDSVETTAGPDLRQPVEQSSSSGGSNSNEVLWIVLPTVLAAALFMLGGVAFYAAVATRRAAVQRAAAVAAAEQEQKPAAAPSSKGLGAGQQQQSANAMPPLVLHAVKPSPPDSSGSGGSATPSEAGHSPSAASACSTGSVQCPQCGSSLSIRYRRVQQTSGQPPPAAPPSS